MLRRGTKFEKTDHLTHLDTNDRIVHVSFLTVLGTELKVDNVSSLIVQTFLHFKHELTNESLNNILQSLKQDKISNKNITSNNVNNSLKTIPNDLFGHIGSY